MTQRQVTHPAGVLPRCRCNAEPKHFHDARRASAGGGDFLECPPCDVRTPRFASLDEAILEFHHLVGTVPRGGWRPRAVRSAARGAS
jgi:hypothetical protein